MQKKHAYNIATRCNLNKIARTLATNPLVVSIHWLKYNISPHQAIYYEADNFDHFEIEGEAVDDGIFSIETAGNDGFLYQELPLDRERQEVYAMSCLCKDRAGRVLRKTPWLVCVLDRNDEAPVFARASLRARVLEDTTG